MFFERSRPDRRVAHKAASAVDRCPPPPRDSSPSGVLAVVVTATSIVRMARSPCPLSHSQFLAEAEPLKISVDGQDMLAEVKAFSTGSFGWYLNGKTMIPVDGKAVSVQIGMNPTIVGSKEAPRE